MKKIFWFALITLIFSSCGKIENSSSLDDVLYGNYVDTGTPDFLTAKAAINANCLQCHAAWKTYTSNDFVAANLVVRGDANNSKLYYRNVLATTGPGPHNMPNSGYPPISTADLGAMANWINAL